MPRMRTWSCVVLALCSGCIVPRSMVVGQMAAPVGRGATDVGVFTGVSYASQTNPAFESVNSTNDPITVQERTAGFAAPNFEANLQYGFNENVGLNVHASSAGIQPGVKFTVNNSKVANFAILPEVAVGYGSTRGLNLVAGADGLQQEMNPATKTSFTFLGGLKALVSHKSGFYAGVSYDFMFNRQYSSAAVGTANTTDQTEAVTSTIAHQIAVGIGIDITLGMVHLRPEVDVAFYPGISQTKQARVGADFSSPLTAGGGFGFAIMPGFTISVASPRRELTAEEEEEEAEAARQEKLKKRRAGEDDDEDDDDEESAPSNTRGKKRRSVDDEDDEGPKKKTKRKPVSDDDED